LGEWDWRRWPAYQRDTWRSFDRLHVFSARDAARVSDLAPDVHPRVRTVPFGLRLPSSVSAADERADTLLFVGNFTHQPNVDGILWFVRAVLPEIRRSRERVRLTIAGSHPPDSVTSLAGDQIAVIPDPVVVEPLVAQCAVVLAPLRIGGGMRVKVAQALGHGKAVVSTTRAADGLPVDRGGLPLVISDDPSVLARETVHLLADADARRRLGLRARDYAEHHLSEAAYGRRLEESYTEVVESHRGRR
jgi:glycosyltransferase involved in cell wall biosynthesis